MSELKEVVKEREAREKSAHAATENGDVQAVIATTGVSERKAYSDTKQSRDAEKTKLHQKIRELHQAGQSQRAIVNELGIGRRIVRTALK